MEPLLPPPHLSPPSGSATVPSGSATVPCDSSQVPSKAPKATTQARKGETPRFPRVKTTGQQVLYKTICLQCASAQSRSTPRLSLALATHRDNPDTKRKKSFLSIFFTKIKSIKNFFYFFLPTNKSTHKAAIRENRRLSQKKQ